MSSNIAMSQNNTVAQTTNNKQPSYEFAHADCLRRSYCTCTFKFVDYPCTICGTVMKELPLKKIYCIDCANEKKLCPFTFCPNNQVSSK